MVRTPNIHHGEPVRRIPSPACGPKPLRIRRASFAEVATKAESYGALAKPDGGRRPVTGHLPPLPSPSRASSRLWLLTLLVAVSGLVYAHGLAGGFIWDDAALIEENWQIRRLAHLPRVFTPAYWADFYGLAYRPITDATYFVDYVFWQSRPAGYHLTNILAHGAVTALLYLFFARTLTTPGVAFCAALLFAVHPVHTEALLFVKNRADVFACLFMLFSLLLFSKGQQERRVSLDVASVLAFVMALLAKESAALFPVVLFALARMTASREEGSTDLGWRATRQTAVFWLISLAYALLRLQGLSGDVARDTARLDAASRILTVGKTVWSYILLLLAPVHLSVERAFQFPASWLEPSAWAGLACAVLLTAFFVAALFRQPPVSPGALRPYAHTPIRPHAQFFASPGALRCVLFALLWFLVTLAPSANVMVLTARPIAEQRAYLPSLGFCVVLGMAFVLGSRVQGSGFGVQRSGERVHVPLLPPASSLILLVTLFGALSAQRVLAIRSDLAMWSDACRKAPSRPQAHLGLANVYVEGGRLAEAEAEFRKALKAEPKFWWAHSGLAAIAERRGDLARAEAEHQKVLSLAPTQYHGYFGLGQVREQQGQADEALAFYRRALEMQPKLPHAHGRIGAILEMRSQTDEAIAEYLAATRLNPGLKPAHCRLGLLTSRKGLWADALKEYEQGLGMGATEDAATRIAMGNLCRRMDRLPDAIAHWQKAIALDPQAVEAYVNLGTARAHLGALDDAIRLYEQALRIAPTLNAARVNLALALQSKGAHADAKSHLLKALALDPEFAPAKEALARLEKQ